MAAVKNRYYGVVVSRKAQKASEHKLLPLLNSLFNEQSFGGPITECKVLKWPPDDKLVNEIERRAKSSQWSVDLFFELPSDLTVGQRLQREGRLANARLWQLGPHNDVYLFMWAEIVVLQLLRILCRQQSDPADESQIFKYLSRAPVNETEVTPTSAPAKNFSTMREALDAARKLHATKLVVTDDAQRSADKYNGKPAYIQSAYHAMCELASLATAMNHSPAIGRSTGQWLHQRGCDYAESDSGDKKAALTARCCEQEIVCWEHVRLGTSFNECGRVHFAYCLQCCRFVIQHCGDHL